MKLYHYTRRITLPNILREGLNRGDVPLDTTTGINAPCLTCRTTPPPGRVLYTRGAGVFDKTGVRIAVEIDPADPALLRWKDFPVRFKVDRRFFRVLNSACTEGNPVYDWYIYLGTICPSSFVEVYDRFTREPIPPTLWPAIAREPQTVTSILPGVTVLSFAEAAASHVIRAA
jgi:hypothetical protein